MKRLLLSSFFILGLSLTAETQLNLQWQNLGPDNLGGPVRSLILDNRDATRQTVYAGVMGGGVWKSIDGAASWNFLGCTANYAVSCLAQASNGTIYVGTGDGFDFSIGNNSNYGRAGNGIYMLDANDNFISLPSTVPIDTFPISGSFSPWLTVNRIAVNPINPNQLIVGNLGGLFKSTDAGNTWFSIPIISLGGVTAYDVKWSNDGLNVFADLGDLSSSSTIVRSLDGGNTWIEINNISNPGFPSGQSGRIEIAIAPSNPNTVYLSLANTYNNIRGIFKTTNAGNTWDTITMGTSTFNPFRMQGWFDNALIVSPEDSSKIYGGGASMYSYSPQTGISLLTNFIYPNSDTGLYIDQFMYVINELNPNEMYVATDRGVFKSTQALSNFTSTQFSAVNNGLKARDMNSLAAARNGQIIGGSQFDDGLLIGNTCNQRFKNLNLASGHPMLAND